VQGPWPRWGFGSTALGGFSSSRGVAGADAAPRPPPTAVPLADTGFGTIYTSDDRGVVYSKSLERHLYTSPGGETDFTNVTSLRGSYITSVLSQGGRPRTPAAPKLGPCSPGRGAGSGTGGGLEGSVTPCAGG